MTEDVDEIARAIMIERMYRPVSRRRFLGGLAGGVTLLSLPALLAACSTTGAGSPSSLGGTINWMGFQGEDGGELAKSWLAENKLTLASTSISSSDDIVNKITLGQPVDIGSPNNGYIQVLTEAGLLQPIDVAKVPNREDLWPVLKDAAWTKDSSGNVMSVPMIWGDVPYVYNPAKVTTLPKSVLDLADPVWKGKIVWLDDPYFSINGVAKALGITDPAKLTPAQLDQVVAAMKPLMQNVLAFSTSYGDSTDYLVRGDAWIEVDGWEAQLNLASEKGVTLAFDFFTDFGGGFCDSYCIPKTAQNIEGALAFTNFMLSPDTNAKLATALSSACTNSKAYDKLPPEVQALYKYELVKNPDYPIKIANVFPPTEAGEFTSISDWQEAWTKAKLSAGNG